MATTYGTPLITKGTAGIVLANGSLSSNTSNEGEYQDIQGFCKSATLEEVKGHEYILTPGRYVGIEEAEDDGIPYEEKMADLSAKLAEQFAKSRHLEEEIRANLAKLGFDI